MHTILIVDNEVGMAYALQMVLERAGYKTVSAQTCAEADAVLRQSTPDLIILSQQYPDEACLQFIDELTVRKSTQHIPFIVYANGAYLDFPTMKQRIHTDAVLIRPASAQTLLEKVYRLLKVAPIG